jgi:4-hydroxy-3-methylbut-2-enyl diphosphate reductase
VLQEVVLAEPRGFCAGVDRAIEIVERALHKFGAPIYVRHEIVHNTYVVDDLKRKGAIFVEDLGEVPPGATLVFSAHGVSQSVRKEAAERGFSIFDATCPLVSKVHMEVAKLAREGYQFIMIGHKGHPEVEGTMGQLDRGIYLVEDVDDVERVEIAPGQPLAVVTQTTLSVDDAAEIMAAVKRRFPGVRQPKQQDICYATQNRQDAVKLLAPGVDVLIVVGSPSSSNSNRLRELAERLGADAYMVDTADDLRAEWFEGKRRVGLTAGASAPEGAGRGGRRRGCARSARCRCAASAARRSASTFRCRWARRQGDARGAEVALLRAAPVSAADGGGKRIGATTGAAFARALSAPLSHPSQAQPPLAACCMLAQRRGQPGGQSPGEQRGRDPAPRCRRREDPRRAQRADDNQQGDDEDLGHGQPPPRPSATR